MSRNMIRKGVTRRGRIAPIRGQHDGLDFTYLPLPPEEVAELDQTVRKIGERNVGEATRVLAGLLARRLQDWSEVEGEPDRESKVEISAVTVAAMPMAILDRLRWIISGVEPIDLPADVDDHEFQLAKAEKIAFACGRNPGEAVAGEIQKN